MPGGEWKRVYQDDPSKIKRRFRSYEEYHIRYPQARSEGWGITSNDDQLSEWYSSEYWDLQLTSKGYLFTEMEREVAS